MQTPSVPSENLAPKASVSKMNTGIKGNNRQELADTLGRALAETYVLYLKTQGFHWNVVGPMFYGLHKLTEAQYQDLAEAIDEIAERIRALGFPAPATFAQFLGLSAITEMTGAPTTEEGIQALVADHETVSRTFREAVSLADEDNDIVTADLLTQRTKVHEKAAWMLRSLLAH
jgi:starvation-inducible DNA-binding protein